MSDTKKTTTDINSLKASEKAHLSAVMAEIPTPSTWNTFHANPYSPNSLSYRRPLPLPKN